MRLRARSFDFVLAMPRAGRRRRKSCAALRSGAGSSSATSTPSAILDDLKPESIPFGLVQPIVGLGWANGCGGGEGTDKGENETLRGPSLTSYKGTPFGSRQIDGIKRSEITRLLDRVEDDNGPVMADHVLALLRKLMNWHASRGDDFRSPIVPATFSSIHATALNTPTGCRAWSRPSRSFRHAQRSPMASSA